MSAASWRGLGSRPGADVLLDAALQAATGLQQLLAFRHDCTTGYEPVSGQRLAARGGKRGPRPVHREGVPVWSAAWTAAATSCAVSASMTMFRRSSTRRTTCPAYGSASCGPTAAGEGSAASGSVTPGTVHDTVLARLLDTLDLQRVLHRSSVGS